jgi:putative transposase
MVDRKPSPVPKRSIMSLEAGAKLFPHFRKCIASDGPVTAAQVTAVSRATGLKERQIRTLAKRYQ